MTKTKKLDLLFEEWKNLPEYRKSKKAGFFRDGIINEKLFEKEKVKILYICKEPNSGNHKEKIEDIIDGADFRFDWNQSEKDNFRSYPIYKQLLLWSYGILNNFPDYNKARKIIDDKNGSYLKRIAFMNIKKSAGKGASDFNEIYRFAERDKALIRREIDIIDPTFIILGVSVNSIRDEIFPHDEGYSWDDTGLGIEICRYKNQVILDFYHPSARIPMNVIYYYLKEVMSHINKNK